jgi:acyl carrier protein phosphodiesterase
VNYLAHSFLSNNEPGLLVGNFMADHLHGNHFEALPKEVIDGIKLHRNIDVFTDSHPKFKESKRFFYNGFEKYSGILVDIYFDHLLAKNYPAYSQTPLQDYCNTTYSVYQEHLHLLPESGKNFLDYVIANNIYYSYSQIKGIERVLYHLSHRIGHGVKLHESAGIFSANAQQLEKNFADFFSEAIKTFLKP